MIWLRGTIDRLVSWYYTRRIWGQRCSDYEPSCACCEKWRLHDELFNDLDMESWDITDGPAW